jgi:rubrerythrin
MSLTFNAEEIYETAALIERNGQEFYRKAAGFQQDEAGSKLLLALAEMEVQHEQLFLDLLKSLPDKARKPQLWDPDDELDMYLKALADSHIFNTRQSPADLLTGQESLEDILVKAIQFEKDSVLFYNGLADMTPDRSGKDKVEQLAKEEMHHVNMLSSHLAAVRRAN